MENYCPKCHAEMVPAYMDGTYCWDGSIDFSGYACPNCATKAVAEGLEHLKSTDALSSQEYEVTTRTLKELEPLLEKLFSLPDSVKSDVDFTFNNEVEITGGSIKIKTNLSGQARVLKNEATGNILSYLSKIAQKLSIENLSILTGAIKILIDIGYLDSGSADLTKKFLAGLMAIMVAKTFF